MRKGGGAVAPSSAGDLDTAGGGTQVHSEGLDAFWQLVLGRAGPVPCPLFFFFLLKL